MRNVFKFFFLAILVLALWYAFVALLYFVFTGDFLGIINPGPGMVFFIGYVICFIATGAYLDEMGDYFE